jgi:hypothetical protein
VIFQAVGFRGNKIWNREAALPEYRVYIIGSDGEFMRSIELICPDDATAKEYAKQLVDGNDVELWERDRLVERFNHTKE